MSTETIAQVKERESFQEKANLFLFSSGKLISLFGSSIFTFAVGLYLLKATGSGLTFATNIVLYTLPMVLFNPIAGVVADRINKKVVVVGSDLLNGIFLLGIYLLAGKIGLSVNLLYVSTFIMTVLAVFFNITIESAKPNLVGEERLVKINSLARVIESASYVLGPLVGGLIYAFLDIRLFILINALSFVLAAVLEYFINYQYNKNIESKKEEKNDFGKRLKKNIWFRMSEGYHYFFSRPHLQALVIIFIALNFFFNFSIIVPLPYLLNSVWKINSTIYGIIQAGLPVGMIIGALLVNKISSRISYSKLLKRISFSTGIGVIAFGLPLVIISGVPHQTFVLIYYTILMVLSGVVVSWVDVPANILLQKIVPGEILGRVISVKLSIVKIIVPISLLISGYLTSIISPLYLFLLGSFVFLSFNLWFFRSFLGRKFIEVSKRC